MATRRDEQHLQTRSQNKPSSLELLVRYFIIDSSKDCTGLLLLREHFQLCPSLSSIFSFCSANRAIQNITAQCGALCTERSPTAGRSYRRICALPWWTGTKCCVALDAKQSSLIPFLVSPIDAESCEEAQGQ